MEHLMRWATGSDLATKDDTIAALKKCVGKTKLPLKLRDACKYHFGAGPREVTTAIRDAQFREYLDNGMGVDSIHQASGLSYEYICRYIYNLAKNNQMTRKEAVSLIGKYKPFKHEIAEIKAYMEKHGRAVTMVDMGVHFIDPILRS